MTIFLLILFAFIGLGIWQDLKKRDAKKELQLQYANILTVIPNFNADKIYKNKDGLCMIALDTELKKIQIARVLTEAEKASFKNAGLLAHRSISFADIIKSEIIVDGQMVSSKSASGAMVGGLLFGVTGAIIGSNTGKTKQKQEIKYIALKLLLKDIQNPSSELIFYIKGKSNNTVEEAYRDCQNWQDTLTVAIE